MASSNYTVTVKTGTVSVDVSVSDRGDGRTFLLLHGGAGPQSVLGFADLLASERQARVLVPTHPGFGAPLAPSRCTPCAASPPSTSPCSTSSTRARRP